MKPHALEGVVVHTPWGRRTIRVVQIQPRMNACETISYSFVEDPAVHYSVTVASDLLVTHGEAVRTLMMDWASAGHPNGSDLLLCRAAVHSVSADAVRTPAS